MKHRPIVWKLMLWAVWPGLVAAQHAMGAPNRAGQPPRVVIAKPRPPGAPPAVKPPETRVDQLQKMTPEERRSALERLPPERRAEVEKRLEKLDKMTPEQKELLKQRLEQFQRLSPEKQFEVRQIAKRLQQLPADRQAVIRKEINLLRRLPEAERQARMQAASWKQKFTPEEEEILDQSVSLLPP